MVAAATRIVVDRTYQTGLPDASIAGNQRRIYDLEISPLNPNLLFAATGVGLFKSTDAGGSFVKVVGAHISNETGFRAITFASDGRLFAADSAEAFEEAVPRSTFEHKLAVFLLGMLGCRVVGHPRRTRWERTHV